MISIKKLIIGVMMILVGCIGLTTNNVNATEVISSVPAKTMVHNHSSVVVAINTFWTKDLFDLMKATYHLKKGDTLKIYSVGPGGDVLNLIGMFNYIESLQRRGVIVTTEVTGGKACSANALLWMVGDIRIVHRHDMIMFHNVQYLDKWGNLIKYEDLSPRQQMTLEVLNNWVQFKLTMIIRDTKIVNNMLDDPNNWYTGYELWQIKVATKLIEN